VRRIPDIPVELAYRGYHLQVIDEDNPDSPFLPDRIYQNVRRYTGPGRGH
jgi:hypothetical protein